MVKNHDFFIGHGCNVERIKYTSIFNCPSLYYTSPLLSPDCRCVRLNVLCHSITDALTWVRYQRKYDPDIRVCEHEGWTRNGIIDDRCRDDRQPASRTEWTVGQLGGKQQADLLSASCCSSTLMVCWAGSQSQQEVANYRDPLYSASPPPLRLPHALSPGPCGRKRTELLRLSWDI